MTAFLTLPLATIFAVSVLAMAASIEAGRMLGRWAHRRGGDDISTLEGAVLGLLALIIGFTVAISISRYDLRREAILQEANAIGTAALRASLLPSPHDAEALAALRRYTALRETLTGAIDRPAELQAVIDGSNAILDDLWRGARAVAAVNDAMVPTGLYIQALNELIDNQETRLAALRSRVPPIVLAALYGIALVANAFVGYAGGQGATRRRLPLHIVGLLIAAVILLIQDLDRPNAGFIVTSQQPLIDAAAALRSIGN